ILLERGDLLRVGRPDEDCTIALGPAGVVGGVAEVLYAVGRERRLLAARDVAHVEIPVANERRALAVGRWHVAALRAAAAAALLVFTRLARRQRALAAHRLRGVDEDSLLTLLGLRAVPDAIPFTLGEPGGSPCHVQDQRRRVVGHEALGARIVRR